jgi:hypothetical protein
MENTSMNEHSQIAAARRAEILPDQEENATEACTASELIAWFADCDCQEQKRGTYCQHFLHYLEGLESQGEVNDVDACLRSAASSRGGKRNV